MNRLIFAAGLCFVISLLLSSCASSDDDPFPTHAAQSENDAPVAGAATPAPESAAGGWKW